MYVSVCVGIDEIVLGEWKSRSCPCCHKNGFGDRFKNSMLPRGGGTRRSGRTGEEEEEKKKKKKKKERWVSTKRLDKDEWRLLVPN